MLCSLRLLLGSYLCNRYSFSINRKWGVFLRQTVIQRQSRFGWSICIAEFTFYLNKGYSTPRFVGSDVTSYLFLSQNLHHMSSLLEMLDDPTESTRELALSLLAGILEKKVRFYFFGGNIIISKLPIVSICAIDGPSMKMTSAMVIYSRKRHWRIVSRLL